MSNKKLDYYQEKFFDGIISLIYILIVVSFLGLFTNTSNYLNDVNFYLRIYVCLFLMWRFNPFRKIDTFTHLDRKIAFNAGIIILTTTILNKYIDEIKHKFSDSQFENIIRTNIHNFIKPTKY